MNDNALMTVDRELSVNDVKTQVVKIQELLTNVMKDGEHYGIIPGCVKPSLLKPGAEKLGFIFRLAPKYEITKTELPNNHREYEITCLLMHMGTDTFVGAGVGICSTMESKYRYRNVADYKITGDPIPEDAKENKREYRKKGYGMKKIEGVWEWVKYNDAERQENPDIADTYNTVLKMAKKRAHVDAILSACAASDIFTQDVEDMNIQPTHAAKRELTENEKEFNSLLAKLSPSKQKEYLKDIKAETTQEGKIRVLDDLREFVRSIDETPAEPEFDDSDIDAVFDGKEPEKVGDSSDELFDDEENQGTDELDIF